MKFIFYNSKFEQRKQNLTLLLFNVKFLYRMTFALTVVQMFVTVIVEDLTFIKPSKSFLLFFVFISFYCVRNAVAVGRKLKNQKLV